MRQVLHVIGEYDYYFNCPRLEIIGRVMSDALFQLCSRSLRVDVVRGTTLTLLSLCFCNIWSGTGCRSY